MAKKLSEFMEAVWNWSERNDIPLELWRSEQGDWKATLRLKDSRGWFSGTGAHSPPRAANNKAPAETADEYLGRIASELSKCCQKVRAERIKTFNGLASMKARVA